MIVYLKYIDPRRHHQVAKCNQENINDDIIKWKHFRVTGPLCGEFTGHRWIPPQRPVTRSFEVFFDLHLNKRLSKQSWGWGCETPSCSLWLHCNAKLMTCSVDLYHWHAMAQRWQSWTLTDIWKTIALVKLYYTRRLWLCSQGTIHPVYLTLHITYLPSVLPLMFNHTRSGYSRRDKRYPWHRFRRQHRSHHARPFNVYITVSSKFSLKHVCQNALNCTVRWPLFRSLVLLKKMNCIENSIDWHR